MINVAIVKNTDKIWNYDESVFIWADNNDFICGEYEWMQCINPAIGVTENYMTADDIEKHLERLVNAGFEVVRTKLRKSYDSVENYKEENKNCEIKVIRREDK